jgi:class 3 adenylate cyclase
MSEVLDPVAEGRDAIVRGRYKDGYRLLAQAATESELSPDDYERLGWASYYTHEIEKNVPFFERAYAGYVAEGREVEAAAVAVQIAHEYTSVRLQKPVGSGWLKRAATLLEGKEEQPAHGYLELQRSLEALKTNDLDAAVWQGGEAERIGREHGDPGLELRGRQRRAVALIARGDVEEGRLLLNEVNAAAFGTTIDPYHKIVIYCNAIGACRDVAAFDEASQWTERADVFCTENGIDAFPGVCRVNRAEVMRFEGKLEAAERTAVEATQLLSSWSPRLAAVGYAEVGEARLRLGELAKAEEAFDQADELGHDPEPGRSLLLLARNKPAAAYASIRRSASDDLPPIAKARLLPAFVEIALAADAVDAAASAAEELTRIGEQYDTSALRAASACATAAVLLAHGDPDGAIRHFRRALRLWQETNARYDAARTRVLLARAYRETGDEDGAMYELVQAGSAFDQLGARLDSERVDELLGREVGRRVTRTFVFTDIVDSTKHLEREGDAKWQSLLALHDRAIRMHTLAAGGAVVDHTGDGFFLAFEDPAAAVAAAAAIQREVCSTFRFDVRIGLHEAEATQIGENYRGKGVHTAARIGSVATGEEIVASVSTVESLADVRRSEPRSVELKGIEQPVDVVSIEWRGGE